MDESGSSHHADHLSFRGKFCLAETCNGTIALGVWPWKIAERGWPSVLFRGQADLTFVTGGSIPVGAGTVLCTATHCGWNPPIGFHLY